MSNIRLANPNLAEKAENLVIYYYKAGSIKRMNENELKDLLSLLSSKRETKIIRK